MVGSLHTCCPVSSYKPDVHIIIAIIIIVVVIVINIIIVIITFGGKTPLGWDIKYYF